MRRRDARRWLWGGREVDRMELGIWLIEGVERRNSPKNLKN